MVGAKRLDKKWLPASEEIRAQHGKGFLGVHSIPKHSLLPRRASNIGRVTGLAAPWK
jgi:hypothetical protein